MVPNDKVLPAPQGNMIAAVSRGLMSNPEGQPWLLYGLGGVMAVLLLMAGVPMLAFALGMYLPIGINMAVLAGAACAWVVSRTGKTPEVKAARASQGALIASGLMAGAALFGILTAVLRLPTVGAPIQYLSVGESYRIETVVDGKTVRTAEGAYLASCDDVATTCATAGACNVQATADMKCNELLNPVAFKEDERGRPLYEAAQLAEITKTLASIEQGLGGVTKVDAEALAAARAAVREVTGTVAQLGGDDPPQAPVTGARGLLKAVSALRRPVLLAHQKAFSANEDAQKAARDMRFAATQVGTPEATAKADAAEAEAKAADAALALARAEKDAVLGAIAGARFVNTRLHPELRHAWYEGGTGRSLGFLMLLVLSVGCYFLARKGAEWELAKPQA